MLSSGLVRAFYQNAIIFTPEFINNYNYSVSERLTAGFASFSLLLLCFFAPHRLKWTNEIDNDDDDKHVCILSLCISNHFGVVNSFI